jgi:hypothetical protein
MGIVKRKANEVHNQCGEQRTNMIYILNSLPHKEEQRSKRSINKRELRGEREGK